MPPKLEARGLTRRLDGERPLVEDASFAVREGEILAVLGPSGAGKSSLLRLLNRLDEPTSGRVLLDGRDVGKLDPLDVRRRVGFVAQSPVMLEGSVLDNVTAGARLRGEAPDEARARALLERFDLADRANSEAGALSGGEKRRVAIARALANDPEVLLLDEPTGDLDGANEARVEELVTELVREEGLACVLVTHDPDQARRVGDRALRLEGGRVQAAGDPAEVAP